MAYIMTFVWSALLISMVNYVVSAIQGVPFDFMWGIYMSLIVSVLVFLIAALIPGNLAPGKDHH
ncbi:YjzD family protein [Planococcus lenghuensis]|uniref:DUF2929 domain-containing protein n=1 Tax=Planococcus lenghuensis TaxID=2213202 RepID=A0A1Q2L212_9BACL|nr:YjzD family protein [Planococcus lenghuensis]AQQ53922.1 DUF2929 domain-containing protein [Planococcus lenghuensis]